MHDNALTAFALTLFAGLSTGLGGFVVFLARKPSARLLSFGLGFSAGVMVFVSLTELLPQSRELFGSSAGELLGDWLAFGCFFAGILFSRLIDALIPDPDKNPHDAVPTSDLELVTAETARASHSTESKIRERRHSLARVGLLTGLAIAIHNFPEGMATLVAALADPSLGLSVAIAVAIHNIPEGTSVAVLIFFATNSRPRALFHSFASGLAEPAGAAVAYFVLYQFIGDAVVGAMLALVGGIMVFISFDELLPTAREYGKGHLEITGLILGMLIMAASLALS
jgi:ZIP family zinc transporter